jgi:hypothetical protein
MTSKKSLSAVLALAAGLAASAMSAPASAKVVCTPTAVNSDLASNITVLCSNVWYYAQSGICGATIDSNKMWLSIVQAAILSDKLLEINTSSESGCEKMIIWMQLNK